jgi:S-ribosylhomocysteine lyase
MERIASFSVDHRKIGVGMYISRIDGDVITYDIRMKKPNGGDYLSTGSAHTIEHLFATFARNSHFKDSVIYVGPMGCRTGFYLLITSKNGMTNSDAIALTKESFSFIADFTGEIPGATKEECGNYKDNDLTTAKKDVIDILQVLQNYTEENLKYT